MLRNMLVSQNIEYFLVALSQHKFLNFNPFQSCPYFNFLCEKRLWKRIFMLLTI